MMKPETIKRLQIGLIALFVLVGGGLAVQFTFNRAFYDNQETINLDYHPIALILGALAAAVILAPFAYWMFGWIASAMRCAAR